MAKQFALLSIDATDYFSGYHLPVVQVSFPYSGILTNEDVADSIDTELTPDFFNNEDGWNVYEKLADEYIAKLRENPTDIFARIEPFNEDDECNICAFFSVINPQTINGITFLY